MRLFILSAVLLLSPWQNASNQYFPQGCYMSFAEMRNRTPSLHCTLQVEERDPDAKTLLGGNDFQISGGGKCISKKEIKDEMWAYSDGAKMYVNCKRFRHRDAYALALTCGRFIAFYENGTESGMNAAGAGGVIGYGLAETFGKGAIDRALNLIDLKTSKLFLLDRPFLTHTLDSFPDLQEKYQKEPGNDRDSIMLRYVKLIDERE